MKTLQTIIAGIRVFAAVLIQIFSILPLSWVGKILHFIASGIVLPKAYTKTATPTNKLQTSWVKSTLKTQEPTSTAPSKPHSIRIKLKLVFRKILATLGIEIY